MDEFEINEKSQEFDEHGELDEFDILDDEDIEVSPEEKFPANDLIIPDRNDLISIKEIFGEDITDPDEIRLKVRSLYLPMAILTYQNLMETGDEKSRKAAADKIVEISDILNKGNNLPSGSTFNILQTGAAGLNALRAVANGKKIEEER